MEITNKYNIESRKAFINIDSYLENSDDVSLMNEKEEAVDYGIRVPCKIYEINKVKVSLVGDTLIDIRFCRIDGRLEEVKKTAKSLQKIAGDEELFYLENGR